MEFLVIIVICGVLIGILVQRSISKRKQQVSDHVHINFQKMVGNYQPSKIITGLEGSYVFFVDKNKEEVVYILDDRAIILKFEEIIRVELIEENDTIISRSAGRAIGGALIGGLIAGNGGTVVGGLTGDQKMRKAVSDVTVRITTKDFSMSHVDINCFNTCQMFGKDSVKSNSILYNNYYRPALENAKEIVDIITIIIDDNKAFNIEPTRHTSHLFVADELMKLAELKAKNIITEEEFNKQRQALLNN